MLCKSNWVSRFLIVTAILATVSCGGSGSGGMAAADQTLEPSGELPSEPLDLPQVDFSPSIPTSGNPTSSLNGSPVVDLTLNYPESGIPAGNRIVVSAYVEDPDSMTPGSLAWRRVFVVNGESSRILTMYPDWPLLPTAQDGSITLLVDVVVFKYDGVSSPQLEFAAVPRSRLVFSAQEQDGQTVYERITFERELEQVMLASTTGAARFVEELSPEDTDSAIVIEHSSFFNNQLYLLVNYASACEEDDIEVQFQVGESDLAAKLIPTGVRRTSTERCSGQASRLFTVSLDEITDRYAAIHNTVFEPIELEGIGSFTPKLRTYATARRFGTQAFCDTSQGCIFDAVLSTDGALGISTYGGLTYGSRYSLSADGRTIYLQANSLIPPNSYALLAPDGASLTLSFLGFTLVAQPDAYTYLAVSGSIAMPALDVEKNYHASVLLFSPSESGIDILGRALIPDFSAENADFRIEYRAEDLPPAGPVSLQISAAIFAQDNQSDAPAALAFRSLYPGAELLFSDENPNANLFESQMQTQVTTAEFNGTTIQITAEVLDQNLFVESESITDLQFATIYDNFLYLVFGGQGACQVAGGRFQVYYLPEDDVPPSGLPSRWLNGGGAPCATPVETQLSVDLRPLMAERSELGEPVFETLKIARYGNYTPILTMFSERRIYANSAGCFAQETCESYLDFRADGTLHYDRFGFASTATYGISLDGRTIFTQGIPLAPEDTSAFLSADGQSISSPFLGELFQQP